MPAVKGAPPPRLGADGNRKKLLDPVDRKVRARPAPARPEIAPPERRVPGCGDASDTCRLRAARPPPPLPRAPPVLSGHVSSFPLY